MRTLIAGVVLFSLSSTAFAAPPMVEQYLHSGKLAQGEQEIEAALAKEPENDQLRFSLGILKFVRGIERLGQSLHEYGVRSENANAPFLRLPVPKNNDPSAISYPVLRRFLDDFRRDLDGAERCFARVASDDVKLPLKLAAIHLDLTGDGIAGERLIDILKKLMRQQRFDFLDKNPEFLVCFDRGDVAWFRCYCHLLMGMLDFYLAFDTEESFNLSAHELFAKPKHPFKGTDKERWAALQKTGEELRITEPKRLDRGRKHFLKVCELNRETWKHILAETDDDHEWLPSARQHGVLGLPMRAEMVESWLGMMTELEAVLEGKKTFLKSFGLDKNGKGLNLKLLFEDPPAKISFGNGFPKTLDDKYFSEGPEMDFNVLFRVFTLFQDTTALAYAMWLN